MTPDLPKARGFLYLPLGEGGSATPSRKRGGTSPGFVPRPYRTGSDPRSPRRRKPSPPGKVARRSRDG